MQREFCAYTLRGYDAYEYRGSDTPAAPRLGLIAHGFHATPWGSLLGNLFYPGYLDFEQGKIYFFIVSALILVIVSCVSYRESKKISRDLAIIAFILSVTSIDFLMSVHVGNAGFAICAFLIISCLLCDEHPFISGIFLGIAMIKPQSALLFCLSLLMMKKLLPLIVAAVIDIAAWLGTSLLVNKGMMELLREFFISPSPEVPVIMSNAGIFSLFFENQYHSLILSMILGIIFVVLLYKFLPKELSVVFKIFPACIAMNFWSYTYINDKFAHVIPAMICVYIIMNVKELSRKFLFFVLTLYCMYGVIIRSLIRRALNAFFNIPIEDSNLISSLLPNSLYELGFIVLGIFIALELRRIYREAD